MGTDSMTRALLLMALCVTGCAAVANAAPADSLTLRWTAPQWLALSCAADTGLPAHDAMWQTAYRLQGQPPFYRRGCEYSVACWDSVRAYGEPREVGRVLAVPGQACSLKVASGEYFVRAANAGGVSCWGNIAK